MTTLALRKKFDLVESLKNIVRNSWLVRLIVFPVLRPKRFLDDFFYSLKDYSAFKDSCLGYLEFLDNQKNTSTAKANKKGLLLVAGKAMNVQWCQIWSVLGGLYKNNFNVFVLTSKNEPIRNLYFKLFKITPLYMEDLKLLDVELSENLIKSVAKLKSFEEFKSFSYLNSPVGVMAISTFSRTKVTGVIDVDDNDTATEVKNYILFISKILISSEKILKKFDIEMLFFTEVFMEEYGAIYYAALNNNLNIVRFAGTVRDNAVVVQHLNKASDRTHFSSLSNESWEKIKALPINDKVRNELMQNFDDRYGDKWSLSKRNQPNAKIITVDEAKKIIGADPNKKIAVIYSHILYDTLFFNGEDIFSCYADWFIESVKAACLNPSLQWYVKIHPSNLWRGELEHYLDGEYEEVRLIKKFVGDLPAHVKLVYPNTPLSPYTWLQVADIGITTRGTSGIELGALGKTVITAGTGRYEKIGFTINSDNSAEYLNILKSLPDVQMINNEQREIAEKFSYASFCMKPFTLDFLTPICRSGRKKIFSSDDLIYAGNFQKVEKALPSSITRFFDWSLKKDRIDFLNDWPAASGEKISIN